MEGKSLDGGIIVSTSINNPKTQDYIEVKLPNREMVIITASANGKIRIGRKLDE